MLLISSNGRSGCVDYLGNKAMNEKETPIQTQLSYKGCPHFGLRHDQATKLMFASPRAGCHLKESAQPVDLAHQGQYCLTSQFTACPYLQSAKRNNAQKLAAPAKRKGFLGWLLPS